MSDGNLLYYGGNLPVLRRYVQDRSFDSVYLDPPPNTAQDSNVPRSVVSSSEIATVRQLSPPH